MCMPKFLFILHGKVEDEVIGANIPEFNEKVRKYIPLGLWKYYNINNIFTSKIKIIYS